MPATLIYTLFLAFVYILKSYLSKPQKQLVTINPNPPLTS